MATYASVHPNGGCFVGGRGWVPPGLALVHPDRSCSVAGRGWVRCRTRTRPSGRRLVLFGTCSRAVVRCVLCALSGFAAPGCRCCLAPVPVPWLWPAACLSGVPHGPAWCAAPRPVRSLLVLRSAFLTQWCPSPPWGLAPPALLGGCAGHAEAGRERGSLCLPLAPAEAGALGSLRVVPVWVPPMGLSLAGPSGVGLGLRALRRLACVDPVTDASGFPYRPLCDGGLGRCTGAVSCGRRHLPLRVGGRHTRVPCVCACTRSSWPGRACRPPGRIFVRLTFPPAALSFCLARPPPGWGCPFLVPLFAFLRLSLFPLRASVVSFFLWFPAPGALGLGALFSFPPSPSRVVFLFFCAPAFSGFLCFAAPGALSLGAVCCLFCWSPASRLFVRSRCLFVFRLAVGCCSLVVAAPPSLLCLAVFVAAARCPPLFFLLCSALACFLGARRRFLPAAAPFPLLLFVLLVSRFSVLRALSVPLCFPPGRWLLPCGCCPPLPLCIAVFVAAARCPPLFFLLCSALACFLGARRRFSPAAAPPPPSSCWFCWSPAARLSVRSRCFCVSRLAVCCSLVVAAPPPLLCLAVFVAAARCPPPFFFSLLLCSCLLSWRSSAVLASCCPPPPPLVCFVGCPLLGSPCALGAFVFAAWPLAAPLWLLPPPHFCVSRFSSLPLGAPPLFFSLLLCSCLLTWRSSAVLACCCPPPPSSCLCCWSPAARLSVSSRCFCVSRLAVRCSLVVAAPPSLCVSRFLSLPLGAPPFFFSAALLLPAFLALVAGSRRLLPPPPPPLFCFVGRPLLGSPCALGVFLFSA